MSLYINAFVSNHNRPWKKDTDRVLIKMLAKCRQVVCFNQFEKHCTLRMCFLRRSQHDCREAHNSRLLPSGQSAVEVKCKVPSRMKGAGPFCPTLGCVSGAGLSRSSAPPPASEPGSTRILVFFLHNYNYTNISSLHLSNRVTQININCELWGRKKEKKQQEKQNADVIKQLSTL